MRQLLAIITFTTVGSSNEVASTLAICRNWKMMWWGNDGNLESKGDLKPTPKAPIYA